MSTLLFRPSIAEPDRTPWIAAIELLYNDIEKWCSEKGWQTRRSDVEVDEGFGIYQAPGLTIATDKAQILLEPIGQLVGGAKGRVDMMVWPALYKVMLLWNAKHNPDDEWTLELDSGIDWPDGWNKNSFYTFVNILLRRA